MFTGIESEDLDRAVKLLEEYTKRVKTNYESVYTAKRQSLLLTYVIAIIIMLVSSLIVFLFEYMRYFIEIVSNYAIVIALALGAIIYLAITIVNVRSSIRTSLDDLHVSRRQLDELTALVSQYNEHNSRAVSELRRFELNIKLKEAEELLYKL